MLFDYQFHDDVFVKQAAQGTDCTRGPLSDQLILEALPDLLLSSVKGTE